MGWKHYPVALSIVTLLGTSACLDKDGSKFESVIYPGSGGLKAEFFTFPANGDAFTARAQKVGSRAVDPVNFEIANANTSAPIAPGVPRTRFAVRWTGYFLPPKTGRYVLCTCSDDGIRMVFNGERVLSDMAFGEQSARFWGANAIQMRAGDKLPIRIDYFQHSNSARMKFYWMYEPASNDWQDSCYSDDVNNEGQPVKSDDCGPNDRINPKLSLVHTGSLVPATDEIDREVASCEQTPVYLPEEQLPDPDDVNVAKARNLFERLTGEKIPLFDARLKQMALFLAEGKAKEAARIASSDNGFYDRVVRNFGAKISNREETPDAPLNDMTATIIGITRDRIDARQLLTSNYLYRGKQILFWGDRRIYSPKSLIWTNDHYREVEATNVPLACALDNLSRFDQSRLPAGFQQTVGVPDAQQNAMKTNPDPAGVLTSRAFAESHIIAGTNRRPIEKAFEYFLCAPVDAIRTSEVSDQWIGRDVERFPDGPASNNDFHNNCKTCHGTLDSLRPAFASLHFENGVLKFAPNFIENRRDINQAMEAANNMKLTPTSREADPNAAVGNRYLPVTWKMNHNVNYPEGYFVKDTTFKNVFAETTLGSRFGFSQTDGAGVREFGRMIATSRAFPRCMAKRVYSEVCKNDPMSKDFPEELRNWLDNVGDQFAENGFDLKDLFETLATTCLSSG